jgi:hypothetical protein
VIARAMEGSVVRLVNVYAALRFTAR